MRMRIVPCFGLILFYLSLALAATATAAQWPQYSSNPFIIKTDVYGEDDGVGGLIAADVDGDSRPDYLVTKPGIIAVYANSGEKLWIRGINIQVIGWSEHRGLPGWSAPGLQAADVDGDGNVEVIFITKDGRLHYLDGRTGKTRKTFSPPPMDGMKKWEHVIVANLRGKGDRDLILQAMPTDGIDSRKGKMRGRMMAAFAAEDPASGPLWTVDDYWGPAHGTARVADLDGDGRDEVAGGTIIDDDGTHCDKWEYKGASGQKRDGSWHFDSVFLYDVRPELPGLEVVLLEENTEHVSLVSPDSFFWRTHHKLQEPQNAAVGEFDLQRPGLEIWCRSRYNQHQKPFVFDSRGNLIADYLMDDVAPAGWTASGVEVIWTIDWTGGPRQLAAAKERHQSGDVCIFEPLTGKFVQRFAEKADKLYVADVSGDWREEIIVQNGGELHIYFNEEPNPAPDKPRLWNRNEYQRSKMTWNYYSP
jgi:rhamnogalacturonan lyase-like protein/VCBS repeat protein